MVQSYSQAGAELQTSERNLKFGTEVVEMDTPPWWESPRTCGWELMSGRGTTCSCPV
jgi:hypothetical protein